jgi:CBS domain-containing protein
MGAGREIRLTAEPLTVAEDTALQEVVDLMEKRRIADSGAARQRARRHRQPPNLLHALAGVAREVKRVAAGDQIRDRVVANRKPAMDPFHSSTSSSRTGGRAWGTITDERERQAMIVVAENVPGVKSVKIGPGSTRLRHGAHQSDDEPVQAKAS